MATEENKKTESATDKKCFNCGGSHFVRDCPNPLKEGLKAKRGLLSRRKTTGEGIPNVGEIFKGSVVSIQSFGAFVQIQDGTVYRDGLLHISAISPKRINRVEDCLDFGEEIWVKVSQVKELDGKYSLDMRYVNQETGEDLDPENEQGEVKGGKMPREEKEEAKDSSDSESSSSSDKKKKKKDKKEGKKEAKKEGKDIKKMALKKLKKAAKKLKKLQKKAMKKEKKKGKEDADSSDSDSSSSGGNLESKMAKARAVVEKLGKIAGIEVPTTAQQPQSDQKSKEMNHPRDEAGDRGRGDFQGQGDQWRDGRDQWQDDRRPRANSRGAPAAGTRRRYDNDGGAAAGDKRSWRGDSRQPATRRQRVDYDGQRDVDHSSAWNGNDRQRDDWGGRGRGGKARGDSRGRGGGAATALGGESRGRGGGGGRNRGDSRDRGGRPTGPWLNSSKADGEQGRNGGGRGDQGDRFPERGDRGDRIPERGDRGDRMPERGERSDRIPERGDRNGGGRHQRDSRIPEQGEVIKRPYNSDQRDRSYRDERSYHGDRADHQYNDRGRY